MITDDTANPMVIGERPKYVFWEGVFQRFGRLSASEVAVVQAFHEFPDATDVELGRKLHLCRETVNKIKNAEWFGDVLLAYALKRRGFCQAKYKRLMEFCLDRMTAEIGKRGVDALTTEKTAFLTLVGKSFGMLEPDVAVNVHAVGDRQVVLVGQQIRSMVEAVNTTTGGAQPPAAVSPCGESRVTNSVEVSHAA